MNNYEPLPNRVAAGVECGMVSYAVATDPMSSGLPLVQRCMVAGVAWVAYEYMLDDKLVA
jgi:hypothetical protein